MAVRDRVVRWVLGCGAGVALLAWVLVGPVPGLLLIVLAVVAAAVVYRVEPPTVDLDGTPWLDDVAEPDRGRTIDQ